MLARRRPRLFLSRSLIFLGLLGLSCASPAHATLCGDGIKHPAEQCDDGANNSDSKPDACRLNCTNPRCSDGVVDTGEECDDGNTLDCDECSSRCLSQFCGDNIVQACAGEGCDDGVDNSDTPNRCRTDCRTPSCGDAIVDTISNGEQCDDGNDADGDGCSVICKFQQLCGDVTVDGQLTVSDAILVLKRGIGIDVECPAQICDVDTSGTVDSRDALRILRRSVDLSTAMHCNYDPDVTSSRSTS